MKASLLFIIPSPKERERDVEIGTQVSASNRRVSEVYFRSPFLLLSLLRPQTLFLRT